MICDAPNIVDQIGARAAVYTDVVQALMRGVEELDPSEEMRPYLMQMVGLCILFSESVRELPEITLLSSDLIKLCWYFKGSRVRVIYDKDEPTIIHYQFWDEVHCYGHQNTLSRTNLHVLDNRLSMLFERWKDYYAE